MEAKFTQGEALLLGCLIADARNDGRIDQAAYDELFRKLEIMFQEAKDRAEFDRLLDEACN